MSKVPVSAVIVTKNEEDNIDMCLGSLKGWADEIVIVDDESSDKTVEMAAKYTDCIFHRKMDIEGKHRNWAYQKARNEWVISLDADEYVTEELKKEIDDALPGTEHSAFSIPLINFIGSYQVRHSGWYPASKVRLFKKSVFRYEEVKVHPRAFLDDNGSCGHLSKDIVHKGYPDLAHFLGSLNRQTTWEAEKWIEQGKTMKPFKMFWRANDRFWRTFLRKKGYKDGFFGFIIAYFASLYQMMSYMKYRHMVYEQKVAKGEENPKI